jgi:hypothetical protein
MNDIISFKSMNNNWERIELNRTEQNNQQNEVYLYAGTIIVLQRR